ncbi:hypothetical protein GCM10010245_88050 [Streptomyces spectabilis]|nr:hypothetical protein GCM10010245_88050 [Streptomyces spectabilis]
MTAALHNWARGATSSRARHSAATSTVPPFSSMCSSSSMSTFGTRAVIRDAFSSCGSVDSRSLSVRRFAVLINRVAISTVNRSSASSIALASRCRITAVSIAVRLGSLARSSVCAFDPRPYQPSAASRFGGSLSSFNRPSRYTAISSTRCSARFIAVPVVFVGGRRSSSRYENRFPSGTTNSPARSPGSDWSARYVALATVACSRVSAISRTSDTCRASTDTPGSSTRFLRSQPTA